MFPKKFYELAERDFREEWKNKVGLENAYDPLLVKDTLETIDVLHLTIQLLEKQHDKYRDAYNFVMDWFGDDPELFEEMEKHGLGDL